MGPVGEPWKQPLLFPQKMQRPAAIHSQLGKSGRGFPPYSTNSPMAIYGCCRITYTFRLSVGLWLGGDGRLSPLTCACIAASSGLLSVALRSMQHVGGGLLVSASRMGLMMSSARQMDCTPAPTPQTQQSPIC